MGIIGFKHTDETKQKIREKAVGRKASEETIQKLKESHKTISEETRKKMAIASKLRWDTDINYREKILASINSRRGVPRTEETRRKISATKMGHIVLDESRKKISANRIGKYGGRNNPRWLGGVSYFPYCEKFTREFKERVRAFFDYKCINCGEPQLVEKHHVHHVNFNKQACCDGSKPLFVILCRSCHVTTNHNRDFWNDHYTNILNNYYGGKCFFTKEEMAAHTGGEL